MKKKTEFFSPRNAGQFKVKTAEKRDKYVFF